jgi:hypothetical protein
MPLAFASPAPVVYQSWRILLGAESALAKCESPDIGMTLRKRDFDVGPRLNIQAGRKTGA